MTAIPQTGFAISPRIAIALIFFSRGFVQGNWFPRIPGMVNALDIPSSQLGFIWFSLALFNMLAFSIAARLIRRYGTAQTHLLFAVPYPLMFVLAGLAPNIPLFALSMMVFGLLNGGYDISTSVQGGIIERVTRRPLVSALYGFFSLGALTGSLMSGFIAQARVPIALHFAVIALVAIPLSFFLRRFLLPDEKRLTKPSAKRRRLSLPPRVLVPLGVTVICVAFAEETINNWVALYMRSDLGSAPAIAGMAYTGFAVATFTGRILGDRIISRLGVDRVISTGAIVAASGIAFGVIVNQPWALVVGYTVVGAGLSVIVPVTYRRAGEMPGMSPADAVSQVASIGFIGFMAGPILIGFLSDIISLRFALALVSVMLVGIVAMVRLSPAGGTQVTVQDQAPKIRPRQRWRPRPMGSRPNGRGRTSLLRSGDNRSTR